jgi:hypothetical protein
MMLLDLVSSAFAVVYLIMILEIIFTSTRNVMYKQQAFEGRLLFFIYSLAVYYKNFRVSILLLDKFLNEPIIQAYQLLNAFLTNFFGLSIAESPVPIFIYVIPASFVFHFVKYWFRYGFGDRRIANMVALVAVAMFLSSGGLGLVNWVTAPFGGFLFAPFVVWFQDWIPTADISSLAFQELIDGLEPWMYLVIGAVLFLVAVLILIMFGRMTLKKTAEEEFAGDGNLLKVLALFLGSAVFLSAVTVVISSFLLYGTFWTPSIGSQMLNVFYGLLTLNGLALFVEILVFVAIYYMLKNMRTAFGVNKS